MRALIGIPTLSRGDLLLRNKTFLEGVRAPDQAVILDNGRQDLDLRVETRRAEINLGVAGSWNYFMNLAFRERDHDVLILLQDDILWDLSKIEEAKRLVAARPDVDLFLSFLEFSVQVHRRENLEALGPYDARFHPAWCEDDDYALALTSKGRVYQRFRSLDPLEGSLTCGTPKPVTWESQHAKLVDKWPRHSRFGINLTEAAYYESNRGLTLADLEG